MESENIKYGVLDTTCNSIYNVFDSLELAKRHLEVQAVEEYSERVDFLEELIRDHEKTLQLRAQHTKKIENKSTKKPVKKPVKKPAKKGKPSKESDDDKESDSESESDEASIEEPDYIHPTEDLQTDLESAKAELEDRYTMLLKARDCYKLVELKILNQSVNYC